MTVYVYTYYTRYNNSVVANSFHIRCFHGTSYLIQIYGFYIRIIISLFHSLFLKPLDFTLSISIWTLTKAILYVTFIFYVSETFFRCKDISSIKYMRKSISCRLLCMGYIMQFEINFRKKSAIIRSFISLPKLEVFEKLIPLLQNINNLIFARDMKQNVYLHGMKIIYGWMLLDAWLSFIGRRVIRWGKGL